MPSKITTTPTPIEVIEAINNLGDDLDAAKTELSDAIENIEVPVTSVNNMTGAVSILDYVTGLSVNGTTITYTKKDGTSGKISTINTSNWTISNGTTGWARDGSTGLTMQWGLYTNSGSNRVITFPRTFTTVYYANVISPDNCETFVKGTTTSNITYNLCNGYNDDVWGGSQTSRLFAIGLIS